jgi:TatD DNase family protein
VELILKDWKIHMHCWGESANHAKRLLKEFPNLYIGFTGAITFPSSSELRDIVRDVVPLERSNR